MPLFVLVLQGDGWGPECGSVGRCLVSTLGQQQAVSKNALINESISDRGPVNDTGRLTASIAVKSGLAVVITKQGWTTHRLRNYMWIANILVAICSVICQHLAYTITLARLQLLKYCSTLNDSKKLIVILSMPRIS